VSETETSELVLQLQQGSLDALGSLYDRYRMMVYRTALVIAGDHEAASDLLQDVFLRLYRFADRIDPKRPLEPWLYRMTVNLSYTWVKRDRRWLRPFDDWVEWLTETKQHQPHELVEKYSDWEWVQQAVSSLPLSQRVVIVLYYLNDLSLKDISEILDIPVGTVKSRLHYGRETIKKRLGLGTQADGDKLSDLNYERP